MRAISPGSTSIEVSSPEPIPSGNGQIFWRRIIEQYGGWRDPSGRVNQIHMLRKELHAKREADVGSNLLPIFWDYDFTNNNVELSATMSLDFKARSTAQASGETQFIRDLTDYNDGTRSALRTLREVPVGKFAYDNLPANLIFGTAAEQWNPSNQERWLGRETVRRIFDSGRSTSYHFGGSGQNTTWNNIVDEINIVFGNIVRDSSGMISSGGNLQVFQSNLGLLNYAARETQDRLLKLERSMFGANAPTLPGNIEGPSRPNVNWLDYGECLDDGGVLRLSQQLFDNFILERPTSGDIPYTSMYRQLLFEIFGIYDETDFNERRELFLSGNTTLGFISPNGKFNLVYSFMRRLSRGGGIFVKVLEGSNPITETTFNNNLNLGSFIQLNDPNQDFLIPRYVSLPTRIRNDSSLRMNIDRTSFRIPGFTQSPTQLSIDTMSSSSTFVGTTQPSSSINGNGGLTFTPTGNGVTHPNSTDFNYTTWLHSTFLGDWFRLQSDSTNEPIKITADVVNVDEKFYVEGESELTIERGGTHRFVATVSGLNVTTHEVTWEIIGNVHSNTTISYIGILNVSPEETTPTFIVRATSVLNPNVFKESIVHLDISEPIGVEILLRNGNNNIETLENGNTIVNVEKDSTYGFKAIVLGKNPLQSVTWSLIGEPENVSIDQDGVLTVSIHAEEDAEFRITATSTINPSLRDTIWIRVIENEFSLLINSIILNPRKIYVRRGESQKFTSTVFGRAAGAGYIPQGVSWSLISNGLNSLTTIVDGLLIVSQDENVTSLIVRATSTVNNDIWDEVEITVLQPVVNGMSLSPSVTIGPHNELPVSFPSEPFDLTLNDLTFTFEPIHDVSATAATITEEKSFSTDPLLGVTFDGSSLELNSGICVGEITTADFMLSHTTREIKLNQSLSVFVATLEVIQPNPTDIPYLSGTISNSELIDVYHRGILTDSELQDIEVAFDLDSSWYEVIQIQTPNPDYDPDDDEDEEEYLYEDNFVFRIGANMTLRGKIVPQVKIPKNTETINLNIPTLNLGNLTLSNVIGRTNWPTNVKIDVPTLYGTLNEKAAYVTVPITENIELSHENNPSGEDEINETTIQPMIDTVLSHIEREEGDSNDELPIEELNQTIVIPRGLVSMTDSPALNAEGDMPFGTLELNIHTEISIPQLDVSLDMNSITVNPPNINLSGHIMGIENINIPENNLVQDLNVELSIGSSPNPNVTFNGFIDLNDTSILVDEHNLRESTLGINQTWENISGEGTRIRTTPVLNNVTGETGIIKLGLGFDLGEF